MFLNSVSTKSVTRNALTNELYATGIALQMVNVPLVSGSTSPGFVPVVPGVHDSWCP